ncbi:MAG: dihydrofolate reductase [Erysipelotrichales bacterium]
MIKLIVACTPSGIIGLEGNMPWHIKEELKYFKEQTLNHSLLMGRTTFEHIGRVLPNRHTYVLTRDKNYKFDHPIVSVVNDGLALIKEFEKSEKTLFIAGGAKVYEQFYSYAQELSISYIKEEYSGDAKLVAINFDNYRLIEEVNYDDFVVKKFTLNKNI